MTALTLHALPDVIVPSTWACAGGDERLSVAPAIPDSIGRAFGIDRRALPGDAAVAPGPLAHAGGAIAIDVARIHRLHCVWLWRVLVCARRNKQQHHQNPPHNGEGYHGQQ